MTFNGLEAEMPDQLIANRYVSGATVTGDWNLVEQDVAEVDPLFSASASS